MPPGSGKPLALGMTRLACCSLLPQEEPTWGLRCGLREPEASPGVGQSLLRLISGDLVMVLWPVLCLGSTSRIFHPEQRRKWKCWLRAVKFLSI